MDDNRARWNTQSSDENPTGADNQLSLNLDTQAHRPGPAFHDNLPADERDAGIRTGMGRPGRWQTMVAGGAAMLCLVVLYSINQPATVAGTPSLSERFRAAEVPPAAPRVRNLPDIDFSRHGRVLQVGLFSELSRAEHRQQELVSLGLMPHIEKRVEGAATQYAVIVGPLPPDDYKNAIAALDSRALAYFHRPESG